jgi:hypothetical protein
MDTDKPVMSVKDAAELEKVSDLVVLATCNTEPAGNLAFGNVPVERSVAEPEVATVARPDTFAEGTANDADNEVVVTVP